MNRRNVDTVGRLSKARLAHSAARSRNGTSGARAAAQAQAQAQAPVGGVNACHFPAPAPRRIYCNPAPFTQIGGQPMQPLVLAYGQSKAVSVL